MVPFRASRYSGSERPAWRINHTGVMAGRCPVMACRSDEFAVNVVVSVITSIVPHRVQMPSVGRLLSEMRPLDVLGFVGTAWLNSASWDCVS